jgi:Flp pilus assembly pilin Flp
VLLTGGVPMNDRPGRRDDWHADRASRERSEIRSTCVESAVILVLIVIVVIVMLTTMGAQIETAWHEIVANFW